MAIEADDHVYFILDQSLVIKLTRLVEVAGLTVAKLR